MPLLPKLDVSRSKEIGLLLYVYTSRMLKAAEFESVVIPDLMSDVFVLSSRPKIIAITLFPYIHSTIFLYNVQ